MKGRNKVYIIDEVHMLSPGAHNALLKTLEEPPENVVFILATTEPQKLPATILSRCMRLDFRRVSEDVIVDNMKKICTARGVEADPGALALIAANADGSVRDSLSILEQCISTGDRFVSRDDVAELLGTAGEESLIGLTGSVIEGRISEALLFLDQIIRSGSDVKQFMKEWLADFRNLLMAKYVEKPENILSMSVENVMRVKAQSAEITTEILNRAITDLTKTISDAKWSSQPRVLLEMCIVRLGAPQESEEAFVFRRDAAVRQHLSSPQPASQPQSRLQSQPETEQIRTRGPEPAQPAEDVSSRTHGGTGGAQLPAGADGSADIADGGMMIFGDDGSEDAFGRSYADGFRQIYDAVPAETSGVTAPGSSKKFTVTA